MKRRDRLAWVWAWWTPILTMLLGVVLVGLLVLTGLVLR